MLPVGCTDVRGQCCVLKNEYEPMERALSIKRTPLAKSQLARVERISRLVKGFLEVHISNAPRRFLLAKLMGNTPG